MGSSERSAGCVRICPLPGIPAGEHVISRNHFHRESTKYLETFQKFPHHQKHSETPAARKLSVVRSGRPSSGRTLILVIVLLRLSARSARFFKDLDVLAPQSPKNLLARRCGVSRVGQRGGVFAFWGPSTSLPSSLFGLLWADA